MNKLSKLLILLAVIAMLVGCLAACGPNGTGNEGGNTENGGEQGGNTDNGGNTGNTGSDSGDDDVVIDFDDLT